MNHVSVHLLQNWTGTFQKNTQWTGKEISSYKAKVSHFKKVANYLVTVFLNE